MIAPGLIRAYIPLTQWYNSNMDSPIIVILMRCIISLAGGSYDSNLRINRVHDQVLTSQLPTFTALEITSLHIDIIQFFFRSFDFSTHYTDDIIIPFP